MKPNIHPKFEDIQVTCTSCGQVFTTGSALCAPLSINVCNKCHPFYTGKQKVVDTAGRVKRMQDKFGAFSLKDMGSKPEAEQGKK